MTGHRDLEVGKEHSGETQKSLDYFIGYSTKTGIVCLWSFFSQIAGETLVFRLCPVIRFGRSTRQFSAWSTVQTLVGDLWWTSRLNSIYILYILISTLLYKTMGGHR